MARILIIEDEIIIARFIEQQLHSQFECTTRVALSGRETREVMKEMLPHLLLCDIHLQEEQTGIDLVSELRRQFAFEVIFITSYQSRNMIERAAATSPANYIVKPIDETQLFAAIQLAITRIKAGNHTGKSFLSSNTLFTETELRILRLIREKKTTQDIAENLHLSPYTIKNHRHAICRKLELGDENNALLRWVVQNGAFL